MLLLGSACYGAAMVVGLIAWFFRKKLGPLHGLAYAIAAITAILAAISTGGGPLWLTLAVLAALPTVRAGSPWHVGLAIAGSAGYLWALFSN